MSKLPSPLFSFMQIGIDIFQRDVHASMQIDQIEERVSTQQDCILMADSHISPLTVRDSRFYQLFLQKYDNTVDPCE